MGKVWRARHTGLKRDDALKVLPDAFGSDPERLARFQREAQVLASLNHPNIAHVYGLEESDGTQALVMELVEGPTLADRIAQGRIPLDEALAIARQITQALEAAHEQGIVHRDLKPANIKLRPDGTVKVLDFGLAKALGGGDWNGVAATQLSHSPTITSPIGMTAAGVILGTAAYMSPEQARGKPVDKRADIWAFGCVLYEMLSGRPAFDGAEVTDVLARVIERAPDVAALPADTPAPIRRLLRRCLEKDRTRRLADAADARLEIEDAATMPASDAVATSEAASRVGWTRLAMVAAAALLVGGMLAGGAVWIATRTGPARVTRTTIQTSGATALVNTLNTNLAITSDGSAIVYSGAAQLLVRRLDQLDATTLVRGGSPTSPFVSPDGRWVGFFDGTALKKVAITGGPPVTLVARTTTGSGGPFGAVWAPQGSAIVFATSTSRGLRRVSAAGGTAEILSTPDQAKGEFAHSWPAFLPDGQHLLFTIVKGGLGPDAVDIALLDLTTGTQTVLIRGGSRGRYLPTGHLVYVAGDTLLAVGFDLARRAVVGTPVPVLSALGAGGASLTAQEIDVSADGTLVYMTSAPDLRNLVWVDREGQEAPMGAPAGAYMHPRLSPDGTRVVVLSSGSGQNRGLWIWDLVRSMLTRAVLDDVGGTIPMWMPDGKRLVFSASGSSRGTARPNLFTRATDGTGTTTRLTERENSQHPTGVTPDGGQVVFFEATPAQERDIKLLTLAPTPHVSPLVATRFDEGGGVVSPDGRWLAFESNSTGAYEIYVRPFPAVEAGLWPVSSGGGVQPLWARNGRELFYVAPDGALMAVAVEPRGQLWSARAPTRLVEGRYYRADQASTSRQYDVSPDGQRFVMIKEEARAADEAVSIFVVQNWFTDLRRLVPTK
jgi:Tol biopolymer transport system component